VDGDVDTARDCADGAVVDLTRTAGPRTRLDAETFRRWTAAGLDALSATRAEIDALNVYPLPDGDTGSNMLFTWQSVAEGVRVAAPGDAAVLEAARRGALLGARGNSGVILAQWLTALIDTLAPTPADGAALAPALATAGSAARQAVGAPVDGTILSVAAAAGAVAPDVLAVVTAAALGAARAALAATPEQLPALAAAGVVDAGGRGLVVLLEALDAAVSGRPLLHVPPPVGAAGVLRALVAAREAGSEAFAYEVQYLLEADESAIPRLRDQLAPLGDSLAVVGSGDGTWNVHVHVNDVGAALERGVEAGRPYRVTVTRFADQAAVPTAPTPAPGGRAVVTVVEGAGLVALLRAEGAVVVPADPQPSVGDLLAAVEATGASEVVVLPSDGELIATAQQAAAAARTADPERTIVVVPTYSPVQGLAALAVAQSDRPFGDDVIAMAEAVGSTRIGAVTVATREALTSAGHCVPGDVLGVLDRDVVLLDRDITTVATGLLDRMLAGGGELVTLVAGDGLDPAVADAVAAHLEQHHPFVEVSGYDGGQPTALLVGVE
jgi:hypothetical protein